MKDGPDIARIAALIGDPARANMLSALMDGRALTATELAAEAGIAKSTTSSHLTRLQEGGLVTQTKQGRHRYFSLTGSETAQALESLMSLAQRTGATRTRTGPRDPELRRARICYDHLAGELGVLLLDGLLERGVLTIENGEIFLTERGRVALPGLGVDISKLAGGRRKLCRPCLDWSARRPHLAGALGAALWTRIQDAGWARRCPESRAIHFSREGESEFLRTFGPDR